MIRRVLLIAVALSSFALAGCRLTGSTSAHTVRSDDGSRVVAPLWFEECRDLNEHASLQLTDARHESYVIVLSESKASCGELTAGQHARCTTGALLEALADGRIEGGPEPLIVNGRPALCYELSGTVDGVPIAYLHTTVEGVGAYHQILAWTPAERLSENRATLEALIASFRGA